MACNQGRVPRFDASDSALLERMVVVPFRAKFDNAAAAAGEEHAWPQDPEIEARLLAARSAHVHALVDAYRRYRDAGSRLAAPGSLPAACMQWRTDVACGADPRMEAMAAFVDSNVRFDLERRDDQRGRRVLGVVRRADLLTAFRAWLARPDQLAAYGADLLAGCKVAELKALADAAMRARGRYFKANINCSDGQVSNAYRDCALA